MKPKKSKAQRSHSKPSRKVQVVDSQPPVTARPTTLALSRLRDLSLPKPLAPASPAAPPAPAHHYLRRRSKLLELDYETFKCVNMEMETGTPYEDIIRDFQLAPCGITVHTLSRWRTCGGHAEWLRRETQRDELEQRFGLLINLLEPEDGHKLHEAVSQVAATQIWDILANLDTTALSQKLRDDPKTPRPVPQGPAQPQSGGHGLRTPPHPHGQSLALAA